MVDFRYHLISLIAVFLALGLGILMGTVVLNDQLVDSLRRDISQVRQRNASLEEEIGTLDRRIDAADAFAAEALPWLTTGVLEGRVVILVQLEGTDGDMVGSLREGIEDAGGEIPTTLVLSDRFALQDPIERDQLALITGSESGAAIDLRIDVGTLLGSRLASASGEAPTAARPQNFAQERLAQVLRDLQDADFVSLDAPEGQTIVPSNAMFLLLGGSESDRPYNTGGLVAALAAELSSRGAPTLVAEHAESTWELLIAVREDPEASTRVATVDQGNTVEGRIAVVLGLDRAFAGSTDHYGVGPGATRLLPEPATAP